MEPFLPQGARLLLLGSFPPPVTRWSMNFYYPNFRNDMWRIMGLVFFNQVGYFIEGNAFNRELIKSFCRERGLALYDAAVKIVRTTGNASDQYLKVIESIDLAWVLDRLPVCTHVAVTGQKAAQTVLEVLAGTGFAQELKLPALGASVTFRYGDRLLRLFRMPSTSRAYPMPLVEKVSYYRKLSESSLNHSHSMVAGGLEDIS
ncbi:MAG: uracil-DNA glycosylase family protein [Bacteroidales bacterium]